MRNDCQLMGTDICICLHSMEIDFNKEERTETSEEFANFSIREYVAGIRMNDRRKCWPFGSLGDPDSDEVFASYQFPECRFISSQIRPENIDGLDYTTEQTEAPLDYMIEYLGIEGKTIYDDKVNNARFPQESSVDEGAKIGRTVAADNDEPARRNRPRKKAQKFLLLSDILRDLAGPSGGYHVRCNMTNPDNVNSRFVTETEDESDEITLDAFFRKQKGVEVKIKKKKKSKMVRVEELIIGRDKRSKRGSNDSNEKDSDVGPGKQKACSLENRYAEVCSTAPTKTANEDSEMEAVMLLASHFNEENPRLTNGAKKAQKKTEMELLETTKHVGSSPSSFKRERNRDQRLFANAKISNDAEMVCACVQKKIRIRSSKTVTRDRDFYADTRKKFSKEKLEIRKMKAGRVEWNAENRVNLVCTMNRNPADISIANSENEFMRGG
ncbi:uncharacterized protein LOC112517380 [Cynara cardunculus var. scolymus]|uniref:uncharacterized protein LOC112517380 n=1 Tax=Cynara cardunculus var. scolymus TaxID=59895 RepID=UPI000D625236|nr:uncharacterized protein LOC112517380 [Cynara cardunculus var. scolymus]